MLPLHVATPLSKVTCFNTANSSLSNDLTFSTFKSTRPYVFILIAVRGSSLSTVSTPSSLFELIEIILPVSLMFSPNLGCVSSFTLAVSFPFTSG